MCDHVRRGRVTNQPGTYDPSLPHAAQSVCDREACIEKAKRWVYRATHMEPVLILDKPRVDQPEQLAAF